MFEASPQALEDLDRIAGELGIDLMLVGAGARILVFDRPFGYQGRATMDWDVGVRLGGWPEFDRLVLAMTQGADAPFEPTATEHRFIHIQTELPLDVVPFGGIARSDRTIRWPGDRGTEMSVVGFEEALACAEEVSADSIAAERLKVVTLPGFVVLKLIAWSDRQAKKDLQDVALILRWYEPDAIFDELADELASGAVEYDVAGAYLLGREIRRGFGRSLVDVQSVVNVILERADREIAPLIETMSGDDSGWDAEFDRLKAKIEALLAGTFESIFNS
ncbi:MAG: nucleotidyl transferase AbiEii/AbiGii toxin family protein [Cyanobacteria bacterium P01_G01_bin.4]